MILVNLLWNLLNCQWEILQIHPTVLFPFFCSEIIEYFINIRSSHIDPSYFDEYCKIIGDNHGFTFITIGYKVKYIVPYLDG